MVLILCYINIFCPWYPDERIGNLVVVTKDAKKLPEIRSQMEIQIRIMWSNPPNHGARIVATVLNNSAYFEDW